MEKKSQDCEERHLPERLAILHEGLRPLREAARDEEPLFAPELELEKAP
ncbi:MAG TPA: hypothetical protein VEK15_21250 [Vicinamibacteria bacterium]|nr:hypothetical protein [Vicinamibacteria bacterium]